MAAENIVVADCDVDAADMHLLMQPDFAEEEDFYSGLLAEINQDICIRCGKCEEVCRFNGITISKGKFIVSPLDCEGCGYCARICPEKAIHMNNQLVGKCYTSKTEANNIMVHASLGFAAENSGKLVARVKQKAKLIAEESMKKMIIVDGSPGIGCPVVSSLSGANLVLYVTEPSQSGLHDLKRINQLVKKFQIPVCCIINKADINPEITDQIKAYLLEEKISYINSLPKQSLKGLLFLNTIRVN